jgi:predicted metalloendopeptidase
MTQNKTRNNNRRINNIKTRKNRERKDKSIIDYYTFINKKWINKHKNFEKNKIGISSFISLQNKVNNQLNEIIFKKVFKENTKSAKNTKQLFDSVINVNDKYVEEKINKYILEVNQLRKSNEENSIYKLFCWFDRKGINQLFTSYIYNDPKNPSKYIFYLQENSLQINDKILYLKYLSTIFETIFGKNNNYDVSKIYEIESEISKYNYNKKQELSVDNIYNKFNKETLKTKLHFNWEFYAKELGFEKVPNEIIVENVDYIKKVMSILVNWKTDDFFNYWVFKILSGFIYFHSKLYNINYDYLSRFTYQKRMTMSDRGVDIIKQIMNTEISETYLKYYKNSKEILFVKDITERIIKVFENRLKNNSWLSHNSIKKALLKLKNIKITIGSKNKWERDTTVEFNNYDYFENYEKYINWNLNKYIANYYKKTPDYKTWVKETDQNVYNVNALYVDINNELIIPNAILQKPFVDLSKSIAYNMANIGIIIGHEIIHGYDDEGSKYNENGIYGNLWSNEDIEKYKRKQELVLKMYDLLNKNDHINNNNSLKLSENISDIGGFLIVENAYINLLRDKGFDIEKQEKCLIEFYGYYAKLWKTLYNKKYLNEIKYFDTHSNSKYRTNITLMMSAHFRNIYGLKDNNIIKDIGIIW